MKFDRLVIENVADFHTNKQTIYMNHRTEL